MILFFNLRITKEQKLALLSVYPGIKYFVEKTISDTANRIIIEQENSNIEKELEAYHDRRVLNGYDPKRRKMTQATKDKISKGLKATSKRQGWKGIPLFEETKQLIGLGNKGKVLSQETKDAISKGNTGKKRTADQRKNISLGHKGLKHKGRKLSKEHRENIGLAHKGMKYKKHKVKELSEEEKKKINLAFKEKTDRVELRI